MGLTRLRTPVVKFTAAWGGVFNFNSIRLKAARKRSRKILYRGASKLLFLNFKFKFEFNPRWRFGPSSFDPGGGREEKQSA
jgi:hypothetical protein